MKEFLQRYCPYGSIDLNLACDIAKEVCDDEYYEDYMMDVLEEQAESLGIEIGKLDVVGTILDNVFNETKTKIEDLGYNMDNFYVYHNYCDSSITCEDYYDEVKRLQEFVNSLTEEQKEELKENAKVMYVLNEQIGVNF